MVTFSGYLIIIAAVVMLISSRAVLDQVTAANTINGFTVDLIHRDSPNSPLYNPSQTHTERIYSSIRQSTRRINSFIKPDQDSPSVDMYTSPGIYLMNISIGTPPLQYLALADTGSSIMWIQCQPCENCFPQITPIFNPEASSSYKQLPCDSSVCPSMGGRCENSVCTYDMHYLDESYSNGHLAFENFTLGTVTVPNLLFGCGKDNKNPLMFGKVSGLIGLDRGPASLITQLGTSINGKFSYCLAINGYTVYESSSKMKFGTDTIVAAGDGVVVTPLVQNLQGSPAYRITLLGITVGSERFDIPTPVTSGNIIVDSGTTYTYIPTLLYNKVAESLTRQAKKPIGEDMGNNFHLCFNTKDDILDPGLTLNLDGGDMSLVSYNYFKRLTPELTCLSIFAHDGITLLGNLAQANLLVGFDLQANTLSIKGADCAM